jgi:hypothetical protein
LAILSKWQESRTLLVLSCDSLLARDPVPEVRVTVESVSDCRLVLARTADPKSTGTLDISGAVYSRRATIVGIELMLNSGKTIVLRMEEPS